MDFKQELAKKDSLVFILEGFRYVSKIVEINQEISKEFKRICYVSFTKPAKRVAQELLNSGVDISGYSFIDCISEEIGEDKRFGATYLTSPKYLEELSSAVIGNIMQKNSQIVIFDSISGLLIYNEELNAMKFLNALTQAIGKNKRKMIFFVLEEDMRKSLLKDIELFADKIIGYG